MAYVLYLADYSYPSYTNKGGLLKKDNCTLLSSSDTSIESFLFFSLGASIFFSFSIQKAHTQLTAVQPAKLIQEYSLFLHGYPHEERKICLIQELLHSDELSTVTVVSTARMIDQFLIEAKRASEMAKRTSALLLILIFCRRLAKFHLLSGDGKKHEGLSIVRLDVLELGVHVTLITTACHSVGWVTSPGSNHTPEGVP